MVIDVEDHDEGSKNSAINLSLKNNLTKLFKKKLLIEDQPKADFPTIVNSPQNEKTVNLSLPKDAKLLSPTETQISSPKYKNLFFKKLTEKEKVAAVSPPK